MKFGGTSVATEESRAAAIAHVKEEIQNGNQVVVVVSAMGRKGAPYATDTLLSIFKGDDDLTKDLIVSCGETISACIFAYELCIAGIYAKPFTAESARIVTDASFGSATVIDMDKKPLKEALAEGIVPVVTGFQGRTIDGRTTTLGRGGSDTSAVIIGGYMGADIVDIYTDVPGVAKADPRIVPGAEFMDMISQKDMMSLAEWGSGVIHPKAVQAAMDMHVPMLRVRSTFDDRPGTAIVTESTEGLAGIAVLKDLAKAPASGADLIKSLPEGSNVITVIYHGDENKLQDILSDNDWFIRNDMIQIAVPSDETSVTAEKIYRCLA